MQIRFVTAIVACLVGASALTAAQAQLSVQAGRGGGRGTQDTLVSPDVHPDRTVTFRIRFPEAKAVTLTGDWMATPQTSTGGTVPMTRQDDGIWTYTSDPLEATVHLYFFTVDGQAIADPINPRMKLRVRTSASLVEVPGTPAPPWQVRDVPHGSLDWNVHHSTAYNDTHEFLAYLPPGYFTGTARYPVLYLVHGAGDTALGWGTAGAANLILDSLIAEKKAVPMIVVMPFNGSNNPPAPQGAFEDYMLKDLIPYVDAKYRVAPGRANRAMAGLSAGGAATYNVGLKHLELFSAFGLFSAAGNFADFATRYPDLVKNPADTNAKIGVFWIGCGTEDPLDAGARTLDSELTKAQIVHAYMNRPGGHVWPVWRWALTEFAPHLFQKK
ncbi:MAG TPA: alpha/beta hydrolase-fold protein [Vicinamibacterales bacterium]|jgi:enterochelin esterase family protein